MHVVGYHELWIGLLMNLGHSRRGNGYLTMMPPGSSERPPLGGEQTSNFRATYLGKLPFPSLCGFGGNAPPYRPFRTPSHCLKADIADDHA